MYEWYLEVASDMLKFDGSEPDPGLLNSELTKYLHLINQYCTRVSSKLHSRQVIALAIVNFKLLNPELKLYGE